MLMREIDTGFKSAAWNMASDRALLELQAENPGPALRFLSFRPACALVGYFQAVEQEVREDYCLRKGIDVNRRITGGGAIYFDPSQVGWEIIAPLELFPYRPEALYRVFGEAVAEGLRTLGIRAEFKPRNDIEVDGRKISGMGGISLGKAFLFQGTLLVEDRIEDMLYALKVPIEKLKPKEVDSVRERVTCVEMELGKVPDREEIKAALREGFRRRLGINTFKDALKDFELRKIEEYLPFFLSEEWIRRVKLPDRSQGMLTGTYRSDFGTIRVNMVVNAAQKMVRTTIITGDFFIEPYRVIYDLERLLKNIPFQRERILGVVERFFEERNLPGAEDFKGALEEVFYKWKWVLEGFTPEEANNLFSVNFEPGERFEPSIFLFPYCAKKVECPYRRERECPACGECTVGDGYLLAGEAGLEVTTILTFEDLMDHFELLRKRGIKEYVGSCCEPFYVKHQEEFRESGLRGLLINVENSTCYDLGQAQLAYSGLFESQTELNIPLIKKVLNYIKSGSI